MTFPAVMYRCESWTSEKAKRQRMEAFKLWCCRRLLRVWTARRRNKRILKEINPEYSLEGLMLKLKFQNFVHLIEELTHWKRPWCWERFRVGGGGGNSEWYGWTASLTQWTCIWVNSREAWHGTVHEVRKIWTRLATEQEAALILEKSLIYLQALWRKTVNTVSGEAKVAVTFLLI